MIPSFLSSSIFNFQNQINFKIDFKTFSNLISRETNEELSQIGMSHIF